MLVDLPAGMKFAAADGECSSTWPVAAQVCIRKDEAVPDKATVSCGGGEVVKDLPAGGFYVQCTQSGGAQPVVTTFAFLPLGEGQAFCNTTQPATSPESKICTTLRRR